VQERPLPMNISITVRLAPMRVHWIEAEAFTGLRPASFKAKLQGVSPACGRRGPFQGGEGRKRLAPGRTSVRLLPHRLPALLAECGPAPTRASMPSVAARPRSLCSLRLHFAATRLARSNKGALLPHSAAMLGVLYRALSHLARASLRYSSAFLFHPTDMSQCAVVARVEAQRVETRGTA